MMTVPIIDMLFIVIPIKYRTDMLPRRQTGMLMQAIIVARIVRRNTNMMSAVRIIEATMSPKTPFIERMMKRALSETTTSVVPTGAVLFLRDALVHEARERDFVRAALLADADHDGGLALVYRRAARVLEAVLDARHVAQAYYSAVAHRDGQVFELRGGGVLADDVPVSTRPAGSSTCLLYIASLISFVVMR